MNHTKLADYITIWVVHLPERTETGGPNYSIGQDCGPCIAAIADFFNVQLLDCILCSAHVFGNQFS